MKTILVTGSAGFIGFHLVKALLKAGHKVIGIDNLNDYYDPQLKKDRIENLQQFCQENNFGQFYEFIVADMADKDAMDQLFTEYSFDLVVNLGAQAGVRYSINHPHKYIESNILGFLNILEGCRNSKVKHLIYASSSSVYGMNSKQPFNTSDYTDHPISLYAATKKSNELMAHTYSHLYQLQTTGLRFFTVYGPWGRPDMAYYSFTQKIINGLPIDVYNHGKMQRDFTYIDDVIKGILGLIDNSPSSGTTDTSNTRAPYRVFNIGNTKPVSLERFIRSIEDSIGKKAVIQYKPMQPGDVLTTYADIDSFTEVTGFKPETEIEAGISEFVNWYKQYHKIQ